MQTILYIMDLYTAAEHVAINYKSKFLMYVERRMIATSVMVAATVAPMQFAG